jgi:hypothetical protein
VNVVTTDKRVRLSISLLVWGAFGAKRGQGPQHQPLMAVELGEGILSACGEICREPKRKQAAALRFIFGIPCERKL